jgi:hypothetical protein
MDREPPDYQSYLLRLWRVRDGEGSAWRAGLKSSRTGEELGFASLDALFDYLRSEAGLGPGKNGPGSCHPRVQDQSSSKRSGANRGA